MRKISDDVNLVGPRVKFVRGHAVAFTFLPSFVVQPEGATARGRHNDHLLVGSADRDWQDAAIQ